MARPMQSQSVAFSLRERHFVSRSETTTMAASIFVLELRFDLLFNWFRIRLELVRVAG